MIAGVGSTWYKIYGVLFGIGWVLFLIVSFVDCSPLLVQTAEALVSHFVSWLLVLGLATVGFIPFMWRTRQWPAALMTVAVVCVIADMLVSDLVVICFLRLELPQLQHHPVRYATMITTAATVASVFLAIVGIAIGILGAVLRAVRAK